MIVKKHDLKIITLLITLLLVSSCSSVQQENGTVITISKAQLSAREEVIDLFENERDVIGTGKKIQDMHDLYPDDKVINAVFHYSTSKYCYEIYLDYVDDPMEGMNHFAWLDTAYGHAAQIPSGYDEAFAVEINEYLGSTLGKFPDDVRDDFLKEDEYYSTFNDKKKREVYEFIEKRYEYYDKKEGGYSGDKYSIDIWEEASSEFGIGLRHVDDIWNNMY